MNTEKVLGWREWVSLPELGITWIKAKVDTGARTSALHAFELEPFQREGKDWVRFSVHPLQGESDTVIQCESPVLERRDVTDSGGHLENRPVIETELVLGSLSKRIELTLTDRDTMRFKMLLGRTAIRPNLLVYPSQSFKLGGSASLPPETQ
jgi:hypothetical protein